MMDFILRFSITLYMVAKYTTVYSGRRLCKKGEHYCFGQLTNDSVFVAFFFVVNILDLEVCKKYNWCTTCQLS